MMVNTNNKWLSMSDVHIISVLGKYVKEQRLVQNKTQANIAEMAGVNRWTISKIENGEPVSLLSFIQILRALNLLETLKIFEIPTQISPLELAKLEKKKRKRASKNIDNSLQKQSEW
jgi:transcriptional regulator with XRE-family HTH domain